MEQAIDRDPSYGPALAWAAFCYMRACQDGRSEDPVADSRKSIDLARRALQVAGDDPGTLANAALALSYFGEDIGAMMALKWRDRRRTPRCCCGLGWLRTIAPKTLCGSGSRCSVRCTRQAGS
jgi:hypothetical protein